MEGTFYGLHAQKLTPHYKVKWHSLLKMHGSQPNRGQIKEIGLPFPLIECDWSPELEMNMPYSKDK